MTLSPAGMQAEETSSVVGKIVAINGIEMYYETDGHEEPPVLDTVLFAGL